MKFSRRKILLASASGAVSSVLTPSLALSQGLLWPNKQITLSVGYPAGGGTDASARYISSGMSRFLGQSVVVENKPGAGGNIAANEILKSADSHKLLVANSSIAINPHTLPGVSPDPTKLTPIGLIVETQLVLCVNASVPVTNILEFAAWVKAESAKGFNYATSGVGGNTHVAMEYFRERAGLPRMNAVAYKGSAPAIQDLLGNQVPCLMDAVSLLKPFIDIGKLRPILSQAPHVIRRCHQYRLQLS